MPNSGETLPLFPRADIGATDAAPTFSCALVPPTWARAVPFMTSGFELCRSNSRSLAFYGVRSRERKSMGGSNRELGSRYFGGHGQRLLRAVGFPLRTAHDHRRLQGDRG